MLKRAHQMNTCKYYYFILPEEEEEEEALYVHT